MDKILLINACIRPNSRTIELTKHVLSKLQGEVDELELYKLDLSPLNLERMAIRDNAMKCNDFSNSLFDLAKQFASKDVIVVAAPYWDLMFPAIVKNYFETITVNGLTFKYGANGMPQGLCRAHKLIYVTTSGGPIINNFGFDYISAISKTFFGIDEVLFVSAEGLDIYGANVEEIMKKAKKSFDINE